MEVIAKLFATFREGRDKAITLDLSPGATTLDALKELNIDPDEVAILLINGRDGQMDSALNPGDTLSLFPPVGGG